MMDNLSNLFFFCSAPPVKSIQYSAPAAPVVKAALSPAVYAAPTFAAHGSYAHAAPAVLSSGYGVQKAAYAVPTYAFSLPSLGYSQPLLAAYGAQHGLNLATTYGSPSIGYSIGNLAAVPAKSVVSEYGH